MPMDAITWVIVNPDDAPELSARMFLKLLITTGQARDLFPNEPPFSDPLKL